MGLGLSEWLGITFVLLAAARTRCSTIHKRETCFRSVTKATCNATVVPDVLELPVRKSVASAKAHVGWSALAEIGCTFKKVAFKHFKTGIVVAQNFDVVIVPWQFYVPNLERCSANNRSGAKVRRVT